MSDTQAAIILVAVALVLGHLKRRDHEERVRTAENEGERRMLAAIRYAKDFLGGGQ